MRTPALLAAALLAAALLAATLLVSPAPAQDRTGDSSATESHLLFFERMILADAPEGFRPTQFSIGNEKTVRGRKGGPDAIEVRVQFARPEGSQPIGLAHLMAIVRNVETTGDSPWLLAALRFKPAPDAVGILVDRLVFRRFDGFTPDPAFPVEPKGHEVLAAWSSALAEITNKEIEHRIVGLDLIFDDRSSKALLSFRTEIHGPRFRSGFVHLESLFSREISIGEGPFVGFDKSRDETLLTDPDRLGARYEIALNIRPRREAERPGAENKRDRGDG